MSKQVNLFVWDKNHNLFSDSSSNVFELFPLKSLVTSTINPASLGRCTYIIKRGF